MHIEFTKMTGAGNDFVVVDNRSKIVTDGPALARRLCDRRWGVGGDGLLLLEASKLAAYEMLYFNSDGSDGGMCGNGGRCIALFAYRRGIAQAQHKFEALDFVYGAIVTETGVELSMKDPVNLKTGIVLPISGKRYKACFVDTGAPHVVIFLSGKDSLDSLDVEKFGRMIRYHTKFKPGGTNVNFVKINEDKSLAMRTYERGVEAETLACGTGSIAAAVSASVLWGVQTPVTLIARGGAKLEVDFKAGDQISNVKLIGPATVVFEGTVEM